MCIQLKEVQGFPVASGAGNYAAPGDAVGNPMYGVPAGSSDPNYDALSKLLSSSCGTFLIVFLPVTNQQAQYSGVAARDGGYMTVVRPAPADGSSNPLYAAHGGEDNYEGLAVSAKAVWLPLLRFNFELH